MMNKEEILEAIQDDKMMPFIQPEQLASIVDFVIKNYRLSLPSDLDEAAELDFMRRMETHIFGMDFHKPDMISAFKAGAEWMVGQGVKIGETKIYLEDDGDEPPYAQEWLDLESTEFKIPDGAFKDGDEVEIILRKK